MDGLGSFARFHVPLTGFEFRQIQMKATELSFQDGTLVQDHRTG